MRLCLSLLILLLTSQAGFGQVSSSCTPSANLQKLYASDAMDIGLERMYKCHSPDTALIEVPQRWGDTVLGVIAAVYNTGAIYEADSVFLNYCVHRWPEQSFMPQYIYVKVNPDSAWTKAWAKGNTVTGNRAVDDFLRLHDVEVVGYYSGYGSYSFDDLAVLRSRRYINLEAFGDSIRYFRGVLWYDMTPHHYGDGDHIYYSVDSAAHIRFISGWGDCPSGCQAGKIWRYTVSFSDCSVSKDTIFLAGFSGMPHRLANCNLLPVTAGEPLHHNRAVSLYPNPVSDRLRLSGLATGRLSYAIVNAVGSILLEGSSDENAINVATLPPGIYTLLVRQAGGSILPLRFVRE